MIVGEIGDDLRMDYTALGHTVGLAQRMEALAEPNGCYLTAAMAALVRRFLRWRISANSASRASPLRCASIVWLASAHRVRA